MSGLGIAALLLRYTVVKGSMACPRYESFTQSRFGSIGWAGVALHCRMCWANYADVFYDCVAEELSRIEATQFSAPAEFFL